MKRKNLFGIAALAAMGILFASCPTGGGGGDAYTPPVTPANVAPESTRYTSENASTIYSLAITAKAAVKAVGVGDTYVLIITDKSTGSMKISSGTVTSVTGGFTLKPLKGSATITVVISGGNMTGISTSGPITFEDDTQGAISAANLEKGSDAPTVTDKAVYLFDESSYAYALYSGSGTLKLMYASGSDIGITDTKTGEITSGKLSFTFPDTPSDIHFLNVTRLTADPAASNGDDYTETITGKSGGFTVSDPDARIAYYGSRFIPSGDSDPWYYSLEFSSRKRTKTGATDGGTSGDIMHIYADRAVTVKGTRTYTWVRTYTAGWQQTDINTETYDFTLLPGWNIIYDTAEWSGNNHISKMYSDKTKVEAQFDINNWKWNLRASFEEMPYLLENSGTVSLNIMQRGDGNAAYLPSDPKCDRWEHESGATFPAAGKWTNKDGSGEYMVFPAGTDGTMTFHRSYGGELFMIYSIDTANKTMRWKDN
jgi:hypothetical protein